MTRLPESVSVGRDVRIGAHCRIGEGVRLGDPGFGYEWAGDRWRYRDHPWGVRIGDRVDIGVNTVINRGRWRHTMIGSGTKIDACVFVAHNVHIGAHCLLVAHSKFGGSVTIGDHAIVGLGATINPHLTIGDYALIGAGAVVTKNVPAGEVWAGVPARKVRDREEGETI